MKKNIRESTNENGKVEIKVNSKVGRLIYRACLAVLILFMALGGRRYSIGVSAEEAYNFLNNGLVRFSPDKTAFTIGYQDRSTEIYSYDKIGYICKVRNNTGIPKADKGYHVYYGLVRGDTAVGYWRLSFPIGRCIHSTGTDYRISSLDKMGSNTSNCYGYYNAGWNAYCACCGQQITAVHFYITENMARQTMYLPSGTSYSNYFYLCPYDNSLENYYPTNHYCYQVSANKYKVVYNAGCSGASGKMTSAWYYTDGKSSYEGKSITVKNQLDTCSYTVPGKRFVGWSNAPQGEVLVTDAEKWSVVQEKFKVKEKENASSIVLYAIWENEEIEDEEPEIIKPTEKKTYKLKLYCEITRNNEAKDGNSEFRWGEEGKLYIWVTGRADYLTVEFPQLLSKYSCSFEYKAKKVIAEATVNFALPTTPQGSEVNKLFVKVTAYKDDEVISEYPAIIVISDKNEGEIRTSLR